MRGNVRPAVAAVLLAACGCSFITVQRPQPSPATPGAPQECTRSRAAPVLDTVGAVGVAAVGTMTVLLCFFLQSTQSWSSDPRNLNCEAVVWGIVLGTAAYTGSAVYGYHTTGECRRLAERAAPAAPGAPGAQAPAPADLRVRDPSATGGR